MLIVVRPISVAEAADDIPCNVGGRAGTCISLAACTARGGVSTPGHCPGAADIQCCVVTTPAATTTTSDTSAADTASVSSTSAALLPSCISSGNCQLVDVIQLLINVADFMVKFLGGILLIFFIYGGFTWITSAGQSDRVEKGKEILIGALIGMVIVLGAFAAIKFLEDSLGVKEGFKMEEDITQ